ncbi:hypothetical protein F511_18543 [Dorcoceras hygrometricum]|uniref:Uncharacterized protein n=1 Tax=Dorcoceras hygrometricum TaxID=472368 RepID=A0A2Z7CDT2_9LAMI|nr:hypothetical protein F511_18543 [Dorcoceras hygrometricum]
MAKITDGHLRKGRHPLEDFDLHLVYRPNQILGLIHCPKSELLDSTPALSCIHPITCFMPQ